MKALRAIFLLGLALSLAWLAGWGMPHSELSAPTAVASFASLAMAIAPSAKQAPAGSLQTEGSARSRK